MEPSGPAVLRRYWPWILIAGVTLALAVFLGFDLLSGVEPEPTTDSPSIGRGGKIDPVARHEFVRRHALLDRLLGGLGGGVSEAAAKALETHYLLHVLAMRNGISIPDAQVRETIETMPAFVDAGTGKFDAARYRKFLQVARFGRPAEFEQTVRERMAIAELMERAGSYREPTGAEIRAVWSERNRLCRAEYVWIPRERLETAAVPMGAVEERYQADPSEFRRPDRWSVESAFVALADVPADEFARRYETAVASSLDLKVSYRDAYMYFRRNVQAPAEREPEPNWRQLFEPREIHVRKEIFYRRLLTRSLARARESGEPLRAIAGEIGVGFRRTELLTSVELEAEPDIGGADLHHEVTRRGREHAGRYVPRVLTLPGPATGTIVRGWQIVRIDAMVPECRRSVHEVEATIRDLLAGEALIERVERMMKERTFPGEGKAAQIRYAFATLGFPSQIIPSLGRATFVLGEHALPLDERVARRALHEVEKHAEPGLLPPLWIEGEDGAALAWIVELEAPPDAEIPAPESLEIRRELALRAWRRAEESLPLDDLREELRRARSRADAESR